MYEEVQLQDFRFHNLKKKLFKRCYHNYVYHYWYCRADVHSLAFKIRNEILEIANNLHVINIATK